jgi:hypothetical protein
MTPDPYAGVEGELSRAVCAITIHAANAAQYTASQLNWPRINCHCCWPLAAEPLTGPQAGEPQC